MEATSVRSSAASERDRAAATTTELQQRVAQLDQHATHLTDRLHAAEETAKSAATTLSAAHTAEVQKLRDSNASEIQVRSLFLCVPFLYFGRAQGWIQPTVSSNPETLFCIFKRSVLFKASACILYLEYYSISTWCMLQRVREEEKEQREFAMAALTSAHTAELSRLRAERDALASQVCPPLISHMSRTHFSASKTQHLSPNRILHCKRTVSVTDFLTLIVARLHTTTCIVIHHYHPSFHS